MSWEPAGKIFILGKEKELGGDALPWIEGEEILCSEDEHLE